MLILTRVPGERIVINGNIVIEITAVQAKQVKLGVTAPNHISIDREEIHVKKQFEPVGQPSEMPIPDRRYFTVSEAAVLADIRPKALAAWQAKFPEIAPRRHRRGRQRGELVYQRNDIVLLRQLHELIINRQYNDEQVKAVLRDLSKPKPMVAV